MSAYINGSERKGRVNYELLESYSKKMAKKYESCSMKFAIFMTMFDVMHQDHDFMEEIKQYMSKALEECNKERI